MILTLDSQTILMVMTALTIAGNKRAHLGGGLMWFWIKYSRMAITTLSRIVMVVATTAHADIEMVWKRRT